MTKKNINRLVLMLLVFTLCFSLVLPATGYTSNEAVTNSFDSPGLLIKGETLNQSYDETGDVHWYEVVPSNDDITANTHMRLTVSGEADLEVKVYPSKEKAISDDTFERYQAFNSGEEIAQLEFPFAWDTPYYIMVAYRGESEEQLSEESSEETTEEPINYDISYEAVNLPPGNPVEGETCPVELSASKKKSGTEIITALHQVRDGLLKESDNGKELTSLYYSAAPYLIADMVFDKTVKEAVYQNLVQLKPLFTNLAKNGEKTSYQITAEDQQAIQNLHEITIQAVPANLKKKINQIATEKELSQLVGRNLKDILNNYGLLDTEPNKLIIKMKEDKSIKSLSKKIAEQGIARSNIAALTSSVELFDDVYVTNLDEEPNQALIDKLEKLPEIEFVEPVQKYHALTADVQYKHQWSLGNTAQEGGIKDADIGHTRLQDLLKQGNVNETLIAVIDTGVDSSLADLNGKVRADLGYNFVGRNVDANDDHGHGTHVSGIIAADIDNGYSMAGVHPNAEIIPVKVLDSSGEGDTDQIALGIIHAADQGAKVINLSLGGGYSRTIEYALKHAAAKDVTIIAASGNEGGEQMSYPATSQYAIAVGATNRLDIVADYSSYGDGLALVAPGSEIPSLTPDGNVVYMSGTSMAAPHVAGVAGLLLSQNSELKPKDIKKILMDTATDVAFEETDNEGMECFNDDYEVIPCVQQPGHDYISGAGRLNAHSAVSAFDVKLKVNPQLDNSNIVTGTAKIGSVIEVSTDKGVLGSGKTDAKGNYIVKINKVQSVGTLLNVTGANGAAKTSLKTIVKKGTPPTAPKVNAVSNLSTFVAGKTGANLQVKIKDQSKKVIASGNATDKGDFKIAIKKQKAGTALYITTTDLAKRESKETKIIVTDEMPPAAPKVNAVSNTSTFVSGKTSANLQVKIKDKSNKVIASGNATNKGDFKITIKKQKAGTVLYVTATSKAKKESKGTKIVVKDDMPPAAPKVNSASNKSTVITGKTVAGLEVKIKNSSKKVIASGNANSKGDFKITIKKQKAGTALYVTATSKAKKESKATKLVIKDKIPPNAPKVNAVTTNDTVIKGKTEALATVTVKHKGKRIGTKKADSKGNYKVTIKKQKANTVLYVTAKDKASNTSKATKVTVKKYKKK